MVQPAPFKIDIPQTTLDKIRAKVAAYEWHEMPEDGGWSYGTNMDYLKSFCAYWLNDYDWRAAEAGLNRFPQFKATVDGMELHFLHIKSPHDNAQPLLITHGWPGSFYEFFEVIEPLTEPEKHGGSAADAFDLVIPSLPGYGFSAKPAKPIGQRATAALFDKLMREVLGYERYIAQGGDWGSVVTGWLGYNHSAAKGGGCAAIHLNMFGLRPGALPETEEEQQWAQHAQGMMQLEGAYLMLQATKPMSLSYAMMDSPVGIAAWIVEKFHGWSDIENDDVESVYTKDQLLTNIMIYLVSESFATSTWYYRGYFDEGGGTLAPGERVEVPTGVAKFPGDTYLTWPPRSYVEHGYNVVHWSEMDKGGHFAAMEQPALFIEDVRKFAQAIKG